MAATFASGNKLPLPAPIISHSDARASNFSNAMGRSEVCIPEPCKFAPGKRRTSAMLKPGETRQLPTTAMPGLGLWPVPDWHLRSIVGNIANSHYQIYFGDGNLGLP